VKGRRPPGALLAATAVVGLTAALALGAEGRGGGTPPLPDNPLAGIVLFESRQCHQCHGLAGAGPDIGPDLGRGRFDGSFLDLGAALWNHVPGMRVALEGTELEWPQLTGDQVAELLSFLYFVDYLGRPGVASAGERLFRQRGCAACHGMVGEGGRVGPDLGEIEELASPLDVAREIWNHGPGMLASMQAMGVAPPSFQEGDLADLSAFIRQRAIKSPQKVRLLAPGNPNRGRQLFAAKWCAACHGPQGRGGDGGPDLAAADLHRSAEAIAGAMWNHAVEMHALMTRRGYDWPHLTTEELADLVAFLYFLPFADVAGDPTRGARLFTERSCAECHAPDGIADHPGPDLEGSDAAASAASLVAAMWSHAPLMAEAILAEGRPWPKLTGEELRDLLAYLADHAATP
jgi:mono/diheme cytochrome c family protein